ncbi:MAG: alpha/beta fold hydrolase [Spirochaetes bacterium]|nr:alpha/beta fold hydrolase [Spirochaetota bacterium]
MIKCAEEVMVDAGNSVRLIGYYSKHLEATSKGIVLLIHGWEGSSNSSYIVSTGKYLFKNNFDIFRLNLRDHGDSHHLNKEIFKSTLIEEAFNAAKKVSSMNKKKPFFIVGFSLGGNFALRIALKTNGSKIANLRHISAICPVLDPMKSTESTDKILIIKKYFLKKWKKSLLKKQKLFPDLYNFNRINKINSLSKMMDLIVPEYTEFKTTKDYYAKYTLLNDCFIKLKVPVTIICSQDDPIIPVQDAYELKINSSTQILIQPYGGHNGFFDFFPYKVWYEEKLWEIFKRYKN